MAQTDPKQHMFAVLENKPISSKQCFLYLEEKNLFNVFWLDMNIEYIFVTLWNVLFLDQWNGDTANRRRTPETQQQSQHAWQTLRQRRLPRINVWTDEAIRPVYK